MAALKTLANHWGQPTGPPRAFTSYPSNAKDRRFFAKEQAMLDEPYQITMDKLLTPEQVELLLNTCKRLAKLDLASGRKTWVVRYLMVHLACASGLRACEIAWLRIMDFHHQDGAALLSVRRPKGRSQRIVHLGPKLTAHIQEYLQIKEMTWGDVCLPHDLLLPGRGAKPYTTAALCCSFRRATEAAQLSGSFSLRNARHSYSTFLLAKTDDLRYVQRQLGHANQSMTVLYRDVAPQINYGLACDLI
jgi:site-specific recombinase XerD